MVIGLQSPKIIMCKLGRNNMISENEVINLRNNLSKEFDKYIPKIFIQHINQTKKIREKHFEQLKKIRYFYSIISLKLPRCYLSKSGFSIGCDRLEGMFCKNPYVDGIVENVAIFLEKQFFDCVSLLFVGSYRPIRGILRHMLELATWTSVSIIDAKKLSGKESDTTKAMSYIQFKDFLDTNFANMKKKKGPKISKEDKNKLHTIEGIQSIPDPYIKYLKLDDLEGNRVIKNAYSELSSYMHAGMFEQLRYDTNYVTHIENTGLFIGKPSYEEYHASLRQILTTHEVIFYLLLISAYENIGFYQPKHAKEFLNSLLDELIYLKPDVNFLMIENMIKNPPSINPSETQYDELLKDNELFIYVCGDCKNTLYFPTEKCFVCHR